MELKNFTKPSGKLEKNANGDYTFCPKPIPKKIKYTNELISLLSKADSNLGRLAGIGENLPNPHLLIQPYINQEAVLSSKIEGTRASLSDLFLAQLEKDGNPFGEDRKQIQEVQNYVHATHYALKQIKTKPISSSLIKKAHGLLLRKVRGGKLKPGEFRDLQNYIGPPGSEIEDAKYVPPRFEKVEALMKNLEDYIQYLTKETPPLIQCALIHYQFETIHPFFDGNGRIGRLLITLFLCKQNLLPQPLLYLSAYLEKRKDEYADKLTIAREKSDYISWVKFFLKGVALQSTDAVESVQKIIKLKTRYYRTLRKTRSGEHAIRLVDFLFLNPYITTNNAKQYLAVSFPTAQATIKQLEKTEIIKSHNKTQKRNRVYVAHELIKILNRR